MNILIAILALNLIVILHELGHFLVAKAAGIRVLEFSLFLGPKLLSRKKGETTFSLRLLPIGAFVLLEGKKKLPIMSGLSATNHWRSEWRLLPVARS